MEPGRATPWREPVFEAGFFEKRAGPAKKVSWGGTEARDSVTVRETLRWRLTPWLSDVEGGAATALRCSDPKHPGAGSPREKRISPTKKDEKRRKKTQVI
jgi:hypothetical protein